MNESADTDIHTATPDHEPQPYTPRERRTAARAFTTSAGLGIASMVRGRRRARAVPVTGCAEYHPRTGLRCVGEHEAGCHQAQRVEDGTPTTYAWGSSSSSASMLAEG